MIQVVILTETQKNQLVGQQHEPDSYFNPDYFLGKKFRSNPL
jgi:hypothetical protein